MNWSLAGKERPRHFRERQKSFVHTWHAQNHGMGATALSSGGRPQADKTMAWAP